MASASGINKITVDKSELLGVLQKNRTEHRRVYDAAVEKFRERAIAQLDRLVGTLRDGRMPKTLYIGLPIPEEHTRDYDRAMAMLRMHKDDVIELSEQGYLQLVNDDWGWKSAFASNTSSYVVTHDDEDFA